MLCMGRATSGWFAWPQHWSVRLCKKENVPPMVPIWGGVCYSGYQNLSYYECISQSLDLHVLKWKNYGGGCYIWFSSPTPQKFYQASPLVLSTRQCCGSQFHLRGGVNNIWYALWTGELLAMANCYMALVWCRSRLYHRTRVSGHVWNCTCLVH